MSRIETLFTVDETPDYAEGLKRLGYDILAWEAFGDYQGDYAAIIKKSDDQLGFVVIGYGSCSGCDALMDTDWGYWYSSTEEEIESADRAIRTVFYDIESQIRWGTPEQIRSWIMDDSGLQWYHHDDEYNQAKARLVEAVSD